MNAHRRFLWLLLALGLVGLSGAACPYRPWQPAQPMPRALPPSPSLEQVLQVVNANNARIHAFTTNQATLSGPGMPSLRANLAFQRPNRFRLRAETGLAGPELDLGSNEELFWFWVRRAQPPAVYFCRHEQYASCQMRQMLPVDPAWLAEVLGTAPLDPSLPHQGPFPLPGDRLEVRTVRETATGPTTKVTVIDASRGFIVEQHVYDAQGRLVASAISDQHRRDPLSNLVMPGVVKINCPMAQFSMRIDLGPVQINRLPAASTELWTMPIYQGSPLVNMADPNWRPDSGPAPLRTGRR